MVGGLHSIRRKNKGKNLGRHLELSERRRVFSRENMADVMRSTGAEMSPCPKRPRGAQDYCAGLGVGADMGAACQPREEARRRGGAYAQNPTTRTSGRR